MTVETKGSRDLKGVDQETKTKLNDTRPYMANTAMRKWADYGDMEDGANQGIRYM